MRITVIFMAEKKPKVRESSRNLYKCGGSKFVLLVKYLSGDEDKKDEIDLACCTYGEEERRKKALERPMSRQSANI
jgi:hypothetical protein